MSSSIDNAGIENEELARGRLVVILPEGHRLSDRKSISVHELAQEPMIGVDPDDPYGAKLAQPFRTAGVELRHSMRGRFAQTVVSLVRHGLGVALIDAFSVAEVYMPGIVRVPLAEESSVTVYVVRKKGRILSGFADYAIQRFRKELQAAAQGTYGASGPPRA